MMNIIKNLKDKSYNAQAGKGFYQIVYRAYKAGQFVFDPLYRSRVISVFKYADSYHQFSNFTLPNRYPDLFKIAQNHFTNHEKPRLLSFGCSTGEEIQSLKSYLPNSYCVGVDINAWCLEQADKKYGQADVQFIHSLSQAFEAIGEFDALFCLAVFQNPKIGMKKTVWYLNILSVSLKRN